MMLLCRTCYWWKRKADDRGICWRDATVRSPETPACPEHTPKVIRTANAERVNGE